MRSPPNLSIRVLEGSPKRAGESLDDTEACCGRIEGDFEQ